MLSRVQHKNLVKVVDLCIQEHKHSLIFHLQVDKY